jgi:phosphohistidine swiveling domain-containing protein
MPFLAELDAHDPDQGGKARSLAQLAAHGLSTPKGFVATDALFRALCPPLPPSERLDEASLRAWDRLRHEIARAPWPPGFTAELDSFLGRVGATRYAVRSSFASEDTQGLLAAGVYESLLDVAHEAVPDAIRRVLDSALAPGAVAYALAHGRQPARDPVAVLIHAFVAGQAEGSAAFAPGHMADPLVMSRRGELSTPARAALERDTLALAKLRGAVEIEWVCTDEQLVYLQARPFEPPRPPIAWSGWADLPEGATAPSDWRWDASHNPLPLSPAQAGLVALVDERCRIGIRQRVLGGYLFYRTDDRPPSPAIPSQDAETYFARLRDDVAARLSALGEVPTLEGALALLLFAYEPIFGVLQPALRAAHARLARFLDEHAARATSLIPRLRTGVPSMASERRHRLTALAVAKDAAERARALDTYLALFGDEAPIWDVCTPTYAETPDALPAGRASHEPDEGLSNDWQQARKIVEDALPRALHAPWREILDAARTAVALGEADDWLYARTQTAVRRALLGLGRRLRDAQQLTSTDDVFFLPLPCLREIAQGGSVPADLAQTVRRARQAWHDAHDNPPPGQVTDDASLLRGAGTGGRAIGRVAFHRPGHAAPPDRVLVAKTILPTELPLLSPTAFVTETGGPLDHVAAQARERGLPAVVGARGAGSVLRENDLVLVDGDRGLVIRLGQEV